MAVGTNGFDVNGPVKIRVLKALLVVVVVVAAVAEAAEVNKLDVCDGIITIFAWGSDECEASGGGGMNANVAVPVDDD